MDDTKLIEGVEKTGYRLEFNVSRILENHNWTVINNKYYIDDQQESIREIDILAYKVGFVDGIYFYTSLIISCKKDHEKIWALFSKKINEKDPNTDWFPVHVWTNNKAMNYTILQSSWKKKYLSYLREPLII